MTLTTLTNLWRGLAAFTGGLLIGISFVQSSSWVMRGIIVVLGIVLAKALVGIGYRGEAE